MLSHHPLFHSGWGALRIQSSDVKNEDPIDYCAHPTGQIDMEQGWNRDGTGGSPFVQLMTAGTG